MRWDFWRSRTAANEPAAADEAAPDSAGRLRADPTAELRTRARRRLIGAAALLLAVIVIVPAVLDPAPKPLPDAIPIEIPSEKTPFTPRLSLPPLPEPAAGAAPPADAGPASDAPAKDAKSEAEPAATKRTAAGQAAKSAKSAEPKPPEKRVEPKPAPSKAVEPKADVKAADAKRARDLLEGRTDAAAEKATEAKGRFVVQAAASSSEVAAQELADRISATGLKSYVEKFDAKDSTRFRVRVGPYGSRDEAERARARLRAIGVNSNLVVP